MAGSYIHCIWTICVSKLTIIGSDNGLSPDRRQAIIWTNSGILLIGPLGTNFSEILIAISTFSFEKMRFKVSSAKQLPFCLGLNVLTQGSLLVLVVKRLPIKVANPSKIDKFEWFIARRLKMAPSDCNHLKHICLVKFYIQWCGTLQWTHWRSYFKQWNCSCLAS